MISYNTATIVQISFVNWRKSIVHQFGKLLFRPHELNQFNA
jgi:hypothetical protein